MGHSSFGPMWPTRNPNIVTLVRNDGLRLPIHRELVDLVRILMDFTELGGYDIVPGWTWGYANRAISGTSTPSNHSQGTAIDINAPNNPYASAAYHERHGRSVVFGLRRVTDIPESVFRMWEDNGFTLGVKYRSKPDPMHFEFLGSVTDARNKTENLKRFLGYSPPPLPKTKGPRVDPKTAPLLQAGARTMRGQYAVGSRGHAVRIFQTMANQGAGQGLKVDGLYGDSSRQACVNLQRFFKLKVDGKCGQQTWGILNLCMDAAGR